MNEGLVIVISGPSGIGKGTVVNIVKEKYGNCGLSISATSRKMRESEAEGVNYYYKTREEFERLIADGATLEYTSYNGNYYGTLKSEAERIMNAGLDLILEIEVDGGGQIKKKLPDKAVNIMLLAENIREQERRLRERGTETDEVIAGRLARTVEEIKCAGDYDYVVLNERGKIEETADKIISIIIAEHNKRQRMTEILEHYCD